MKIRKAKDNIRSIYRYLSIDADGLVVDADKNVIDYDLDYITILCDMSEKFMRSNKDDLNWESVSIHQKLSENFIREFKDYVCWDEISRHQKLSEEFIEEFEPNINFGIISQYQILSEAFMRRHTSRMGWSVVAEYQKLSEDFIFEFAAYLPIDIILRYQKLSMLFIDQSIYLAYGEDVFNHRCDLWRIITTHQKITEGMINKYRDRINFFRVFRYQNLSEDFIRKFKDEVNYRNLNFISKYQKVSQAFRDELKLEDTISNWMYKSTEFKKQSIMNTGLYECFDDHFIAYKGIRRDRYSKFNFQYQYLKGETYECHADYNVCNLNGHGFNVATEEEARHYCNELVVRVKVMYEDVAALIYDDDNKIRCSKLTVLD